MPAELVVHRRVPFAHARLTQKLDALLTALRQEDSPLCVLLTDDAEIRALNRRYRKKNKATDVLSFVPISLPAGPKRAPRFLGDLVVSVDTAAVQAKEAGHDLFTEVTLLCAHGLLHLCGYDHESGPSEARRQLRRERALLRAVGIERDPLTLRGAEPAPARPHRRRTPTTRGPSKR